MNLRKLARYLSGELPNTKAIQVAEFFSMCENNWSIPTDEVTKYKHWIGSLSKDFEDILKIIKSTENGEGKIVVILEGLGLDQDFIGVPDFSKYKLEIENNVSLLEYQKQSFLKKFETKLVELDDSGNNKINGNDFEDLIEAFLLESSYFEKGFTKEFKFEIGGQKIDRLLRLKRDILNTNNLYLGYVAVEIKFKKQNKTSVNEIPQFESYIRKLSNNNLCKYGIYVCRNDLKKTAIEKLKEILDDENKNNQPFYIGLLTGKEIKEFLENKGEYTNMGFDEFIERSFIKRLK